MIRISEEQVRAKLAGPKGMDRVIELLDDGFRSWAAGTAANEPRRRVRAPGGALLHLMGAADSRTGYIGCKVYTSSRTGANFFVLLFDAVTGKPLAMLDADYIGQVRTGAASGLATRYMARTNSRVLCVIGSGGQAWTQVVAISRVRDIGQVRVYSRDGGRREIFAARVQMEIGIASRACSSARDAVHGSDIVVTATGSSTPVLLGEWLEPGMHVNAIGGNGAARRELDEAAVLRASRIVADSIEQARIESGELLAVDRWADIVELAQVAAGRAVGRASAEEITLFKSNGIALEDVVVAGWLYEQARDTL